VFYAVEGVRQRRDIAGAALAAAEALRCSRSMATRRVGKALALVALAVSALFLIGNVWMAGRWGVPV
jgi:hypothetical protein